MNATAIGRIAWKEFKQLRGIALAFVVLAIFLFTIPHILLDRFDRLEQGHSEFIGGVLCCLFAVLCGSILFAAEAEGRTKANLQFLPVDWRSVFSGKLAIGLAISLLVPMLGFLLFDLITNRPEPIMVLEKGVGMQQQGIAARDPLNMATFRCAFLGGLQFFSISVLFSLLCNRVLVAAVCAIVVASISDFGLLRLFGPLNADYFSIWTYDSISPYRLLISFGVLAITIPLSRHWWLGTSTEKRRLRSATWGARGRIREAKGCRSTITGRLFWQSTHSDYAALIIVTAIGLAAAIASIWMELVAATPILIIAGLLVCWLGGVFTFSKDQQHQSYRFFVQHREHPRLVWMSRIGFWLVMLLLINVVTFFVGTTLAKQSQPYPADAFLFALFPVQGVSADAGIELFWKMASGPVVSWRHGGAFRGLLGAGAKTGYSSSGA